MRGESAARGPPRPAQLRRRPGVAKARGPAGPEEHAAFASPPASPCPRVHVRRRRRDEPSTRRRPLCAGTRHAGRARSAPGGHSARRLPLPPASAHRGAPAWARRRTPRSPDPEIGRPPPPPPVLWMRILSLCKSAKGVRVICCSLIIFGQWDPNVESGTDDGGVGQGDSGREEGLHFARILKVKMRGLPEAWA